MTEPTPDAPPHPVDPPPSVPLSSAPLPSAPLPSAPPPVAPLPVAPPPVAPPPVAPLTGESVPVATPLPSAPLTGESAFATAPLPAAPVQVGPPAVVEVKPRVSAGVWVFSVLLVLLLAGLGVLGVVYTDNKRTAERVQGEQSARITQLTQTTDKQAQTIEKTEQQIQDVQAQIQQLTAKNAGFEACRKAVQSLYDAGVAQSTPGIQAAMAAMLRDCKEVA